MLKDFIKQHYTSQANYVEYGFGQVEPNHLSAQRTSQVYAQLPAAAEIKVLEQGQFVKYNYANENGGQVDFGGAGEWMLVYNEIKLYREGQMDCEFAMVKDNYQARIYSPYDWEQAEPDIATRNLTNKDIPVTMGSSGGYKVVDGKLYLLDKDQNVIKNSKNEDMVFPVDSVIGPVDPYELHYTTDPFHILGSYKPRKMPTGTTMVPRVFKTNVGDIFTTNTIRVAAAGDTPTPDELNALTVGKLLTPSATDGILEVTTQTSGIMLWQVARVYTMPDNQRGVKLIRVN